jgi:hypothetical protein
MRCVEPVFVSGQQIAARDDANHDAWRFARDDGKPAHARANHVIGCLAERIVVVNDNRAACHQRADRCRLVVRTAEEIATSEHTAQFTLVIDYGKALVRRAGATSRQPFAHLAEPIGGAKRNDFT